MTPDEIKAEAKRRAAELRKDMEWSILNPWVPMSLDEMWAPADDA